MTAITAIFSVAVFAVPAGLLGWGFESVGEKFIEQRKEKIKRKKREKKERILRGELTPSSSSSEETDLFNSSDDDDQEEKVSIYISCNIYMYHVIYTYIMYIIICGENNKRE